MDVGFHEALDIFDLRLDPDFAMRSLDMAKVLLSIDTGEVYDRGGSYFPLSKDSARMISTQQLIPRDSMTRSNSSPTVFGNSCVSSKSPQSTIAKADNKIGIMSKDFITEPI